MFQWYEKETGQHVDVEVLLQAPNGSIALILKYREQVYVLELRSFRDMFAFKKGLEQAALYGKKLGLTEIYLAFFVDDIDEENRARLEKEYRDDATGVKVVPCFVRVGGEEGEQR